MIIRLTKNHKTATGRVLKAGRIIETSMGHDYKDFEVLAKDGHFGSPKNSGLKAKLAAEVNVSKENKTIKTTKKVEEDGSK
jgi:precorrin-6x reductase